MKGKIISMVAAVGLLCGSATIAAAKNAKSYNSPGHQMQRSGAHDASAFAPGHLKHGKIAKQRKMGQQGHMLRNRSTMGSRY